MAILSFLNIYKVGWSNYDVLVSLKVSFLLKNREWLCFFPIYLAHVSEGWFETCSGVNVSLHFILKYSRFFTTNRSSIPFDRTAHTQNQLSIETHKRVSLSNCTREARWGAQRIKRIQKVSMELSWQTIKHLLCLSMLEEASNKACLSY